MRDVGELFGPDHVESYVRTDGELGYLWRGAPTLVLTTRGRRSGEPRPMPLIFGRDGDRVVVVASRGGTPEHPAWYHNLCEHPDVDVQVMDDRWRGRAYTAGAEERARLWPMMAEIWPAYDDYQRKTEREIPVVVIEPAG
jgi:deazaflavin-dependent oxidoreductase (nitroreductase family)